MNSEIEQKYRANVGAIIVNRQKQILMMQNNGYSKDVWDFIKGGMHMGEEPIDTMHREMGEELLGEFKYKVLRQSAHNVIFVWPKEMQEDRKMRGQARVSFWVLHTEGEIEANTEEIRGIKWIDGNKFEKELINAGWNMEENWPLVSDWERLLTEFADEFKTPY